MSSGGGGGGGFSSGVVVNLPTTVVPIGGVSSIPAATSYTTTLHGVTSEVVETVSRQEAGVLYGATTMAALDSAGTVLYQRLFSAAAQPAPADRVKFSIAAFIRDGSPTTMGLGAGERAGVIDSFRTAFGRLPQSEDDWRNVIKIANGRWPGTPSLAREKAVEATFKKVYLRAPRTTNANDKAAIAIMAYGLRSARRNLDSERAALRIFKSIIRRSPVSAADWDAVRAIAYSGAKR